MRIFYFSLAMFLCALTTPVLAQEEKWEGGFFIGAANYMGDVVEPNIFTLKETNLAFGFNIQHNLSQTLGLKLGLISGKLTGDDANFDNVDRKTRAFSFENRMTELSLLAQWEPFGAKRYEGGFHKILSPYVFAGVGLGFSNPTADFNNRTSAGITADRNADVQQSIFTTPVGVGLRYDLSRQWVLGAEIGLRPAFNDYVDGISEAANQVITTGMLSVG
ncbi:MAG: DUF6089 family protein [Saprospiraceae bacterium]